MADEGQGQERTERATPRRREKARKDGQVPMSQEVAVATSMLLLSGMVAWGFPTIAAQLVSLFRANLALDETTMLFSDVTAVNAIRRVQLGAFRVVAPVAFGAAAIGLAGTLAQVGVAFNPELVSLKWDRLDPSSWFKRMFSAELPVNVLKSLFKGLGVVLIAGFALRDEPERLFELAYAPVTGLAHQMGEFAFSVITRVSAALAVVAGIDVLWTRYRFEERIKMSRQEIKEEMKEAEGSPEAKSRRRQFMQKLAGKPSLESQVKEATAISVNPTHYAVALRYWPGKDRDPRVVAKGVDHKAARIREIAKKHGIPIIENKPLTRALYKAVKEGQAVPEDMWQAVAQLLAIVYQMRGGATQGGNS